MPSTVTTIGLRSSRPAGRGAGEAERLAESVAQRVEPEVLLEGGEGVGERLGDRARPEDDAAPLAASVVIGRAWRSIGSTGVVERPLDVLRAAVGGVGAGGEAGEAPQRDGRGAVGARGRRRPDLLHPTARSEHRRPAVDLA